MKLLIVTQAVDKNDEALGFFHRWLEVFADKFEQITVICLKEGEHYLPDNVRVFSLGKERLRTIGFGRKSAGPAGRLFGRIRYSFRFLRCIVRMRKDYDTVFVHMNQEYVIIGGLLWDLMNKKVFMWRNHRRGGVLTRYAVFLCHKVFCTSPDSFTARFKKTRLMPVGVDTDFFKPDEAERPHGALLFLGRIAPVKRPDLFVKTLKLLQDRGVSFSARIVGSVLKRDQKYFESLQAAIENAGLSQRVSVEPGLPHVGTVSAYNHSEIYINLTPSGSLDKTIFEAMASGSLILVSNGFLAGKVDSRFLVSSDKPIEIADEISVLLRLSDDEKKPLRDSLRRYVVLNHSLNLLTEKLSAELGN
jgi:glycosyltransferase involved in cell wall biosynthesis